MISPSSQQFSHLPYRLLDQGKMDVLTAGGYDVKVAGLVKGGQRKGRIGYSAPGQDGCDLFGPVDLVALLQYEEEKIAKDPAYRWKDIRETHGGAFLGGPTEDMRERAKLASPPYLLTEGKTMCPMLILHGDHDALVPWEISADFYDKIVEAGMGNRVDFYTLKNAGHGTRGFFQPSTKELILRFFDKNLKTICT